MARGVTQLEPISKNRGPDPGVPVIVILKGARVASL
jgi:hypothetical protein